MPKLKQVIEALQSLDTDQERQVADIIIYEDAVDVIFVGVLNNIGVSVDIKEE